MNRNDEKSTASKIYISCHIKLFFLRKWVSIAYFPVKNDSFLFRVPDCNNSKIKGSPHRHLQLHTTSIILHRKQWREQTPLPS